MRSFESVLGSLKTVARRGLWPYRRATARHRSLPDFIVIGAQKSGTSGLFNWLRRHPQILPGVSKEIHFFDGGLVTGTDNYAKGERWYRAHFPLERRLHGGRKTGEASPLYLFHPMAPGRIRALVPQVRLIAILRNPTERAISQYRHARRLGREPLPLRQALEAEDERMKRAVPGPVPDESFIHHSYKSRGRYAEQLKRYLLLFPRTQLFVMSSEELFDRPAAALHAVFEFVGVDAGFTLGDFRPSNVTVNRTPVDASVYQELRRYFSPYNEELFDLLGKRFNW